MRVYNRDYKGIYIIIYHYIIEFLQLIVVPIFKNQDCIFNSISHECNFEMYYVGTYIQRDCLGIKKL